MLSATNAAHQFRQKRRRNHKNGNASPIGTRPLASAATPRHAPMAANRHATRFVLGSGRSSGSASSTASEKKTASGRSVSERSVNAIQAAELASREVEAAATLKPNSLLSSAYEVSRKTRLSSTTGSRAATSGPKPASVPPAVIQ